MQYSPAFAGASACALALLAPGPVAAQSTATQATAEKIRMTANRIDQQARVVTHDLDLATPKGRSALRLRTMSAAKSVCRVPEEATGASEEWDTDGCVRHAYRNGIIAARHAKRSVRFTRR